MVPRQQAGEYTLPRPVGRQANVVYLNPQGHQAVLGTAGSGKTVMAIHRAAYLSDPEQAHAGPTLLVTYNKALTRYLQHLSAAVAERVDVRTYHHVARGYLNAKGRFGQNVVTGSGTRRVLILQAIHAVRTRMGDAPIFDRSSHFFADEMDWIYGRGLRSFEEYAPASRLGRQAALGPKNRQRVWAVFQEYQALRAGNNSYGLYDWWQLPGIVRDELARDEEPRIYRHVVIDEAQDLPPEAIRSLVELVGDEGSVTMFADYAQQLYGQRSGFAASGLHIRRPERFSDNYRNSKRIAELALALSRMPHFTDSADLVEPKSPVVEGTQPTLFRGADRAAELQTVQDTALELGRTGSVAILGPTLNAARGFGPKRAHLRELKEEANWHGGAGIYVGTYHSAKGLEFDAVIMPALDASAIPSQENVDAFGDDEARERDARLLYVGVTRARAELLVTYTTELTPLLPGPETGLWNVQS